MRSGIVPALPEHIPLIAPFVRTADREELWALACIRPEAALRMSLAGSTLAWTVMVDGVPAAMLGVAPGAALTGTGIPWLIGTDLIRKNARRLLPLCRPQLKAMLQGYDRLVNYVDSRNDQAIRWIRWAGFKIEDPAPLGPFSVLFHRFSMSA